MRVIERTTERSGARGRSEQCGVRKFVIGASKRASGRANSPRYSTRPNYMRRYQILNDQGRRQEVGGPVTIFSRGPLSSPFPFFTFGHCWEKILLPPTPAAHFLTISKIFPPPYLLAILTNINCILQEYALFYFEGTCILLIPNLYSHPFSPHLDSLEFEFECKSKFMKKKQEQFTNGLETELRLMDV